MEESQHHLWSVGSVHLAVSHPGNAITILQLKIIIGVRNLFWYFLASYHNAIFAVDKSENGEFVFA